VAEDFYSPDELKRRMDRLKREWARKLVDQGMTPDEARQKVGDMLAMFDLIEIDDKGCIRRHGLDLSKY
jgi:hypothetical protein